MHEVINANKDHIGVIRTLAKAIWPSAYAAILSPSQLAYMLERFYSYSSLENQMESLQHQFVLIKDDEHFIGFASYSSHDENAAIFHLNKIYILPAEQGKNIGKKLLKYVIEEVEKKGGTSLQLNVNRHNQAFHFYEKQGFKILREEDIDIGNGYWMNDWVMEKLLK